MGVIGIWITGGISLLLLFSNHPVSLMSDQSSRDDSNCTSDQCSFGGLIVFVVADDPADDRSSCPA
jgi:hypothetical protein